MSIKKYNKRKICLHKSNDNFIINNKRSCTLHMKYYNNIYATKIQSYYRAFKIRKKLNNIYIKLPYIFKIIYFIILDMIFIQKN